jgi:hypothetical protein
MLHDQLGNYNAPADRHQRCQWVNGNVGLSPFYGQLSGKPLLASARSCIDAEIKAQWRVENLFRD